MKRHTKGNKKANKKKQSRKPQNKPADVDVASLADSVETLTFRDVQEEEELQPEQQVQVEQVDSLSGSESEQEETTVLNDAYQVANIMRLDGGATDILEFYSIYQRDDSNGNSHVCARCFSTSVDKETMLNHAGTCGFVITGKVVYRTDSLVLREIDPLNQRAFCERLCLYGKVFIDENRENYSTDNQMFFVLVRKDENNQLPIGFFTKNKRDSTATILKMIVVFPHFQRKGYGMLMVDICWAMSRAQRFVGYPQHNWTDIFYDMFWNCVVLNVSRYLIEHEEDHRRNPRVRMTDIAERTGVHMFYLTEFFIGMDWVTINRGGVLEFLDANELFMGKIRSCLRGCEGCIQFERRSFLWTPSEDFPRNQNLVMASTLDVMGDGAFALDFRTRFFSERLLAKNKEDGRSCVEPSTSRNSACMCDIKFQ